MPQTAEIGGFLGGKPPASTLLIPGQVYVSLTLIKDSVAAAGTALLLGAAAMSNQQDPAAASAPFDSSRGANASTLAQAGPSAQEGPKTIEIVATRFNFEPSRIEVTEGERIKLVVTSGDGVHGIGIKKFKVEKKVPRGGDPVTIEFVATAVGEFPILCSEYCGDGHEDMKGMLIVVAK